MKKFTIINEKINTKLEQHYMGEKCFRHGTFIKEWGKKKYVLKDVDLNLEKETDKDGHDHSYLSCPECFMKIEVKN